ncbi:MAG: membrane-bound dehydrogenase [Limisphaerales bacterium]|nr:MAG: membrane-bound dehydrogenase [Limisphaerales bacterium]
MKHRLLSSLAFLFAVAALTAAEPLRVFIRGGQSNRGQEVHAHPRFLGEWTTLLTQRGMKVDGGMELPTAEQLAKTDVLVMFAQDGGAFPKGPLRDGFEAFLKRGGGVVVLHTAAVPTKSIEDGSDYWKSVIGGSWVHGKTKWLEGKLSFYYVNRTHPISTGTANFDLDDEIYYDLDMDPRVTVLGAAYTPHMAENRRNQKNAQPPTGKITVYDIQPQMWTFENQRDGGKPYRAFTSLLGHKNATFNHLAYRAVLLRGIAWAGNRTNLDEFAKPNELAALRYPEGGTPRPDQIPPTLDIHPEFKLSLVASEPLLNKAMNIDWDAAGRLWVAETPEYPDGRFAPAPSDYVQRWQPEAKIGADNRYERPAYDRISILTDTNGDGVMDKKQVFYEGLELVTSFVFHKDGVIAAAAPDVWLLRDTNGDGKADKVEKLYTNLGNRDTHAVLNNLRWGYDGWIYGTHGYSGTSSVKSGDGSKDFGGVGSGVVRFKPDGSAFEQYSSKGGNTWGLQVSWDNEIFWTQPTSGDLLMHTVMAESQLAKAGVKGVPSFRVVRKSPKSFSLIPYDSLPYVQIDWVGSFTAAAGTVIYDGGAWPAKWNYSYFTTEPTINLLHHEFVKADGVSFAGEKEPSREELEFIAGKNLWFRPIEVRTGPDGAMYVVDFCNQAIIHNDTRGPKHGPRNAAIRPDRDHYYGRIWRVDHKQAKKLPVQNLAQASAAELIKSLESANQHVRMNAQRLLVEKNETSVVPALNQLVKSASAAPHAKVAALWALNAITYQNWLTESGKLDEQVFAAAFNDKEPAVRKNALKVVTANTGLVGAGTSLPQKIRAKLNDSDSRVRLEALNALAAFPVDAATATALVSAYPSLDDNWSKAAFMVIAGKAPELFLDAAFSSGSLAQLTPLVTALTDRLGAGSPDGAAKLVISLAGKPASADGLKVSMLNALGTASKGNPTASAPLSAALKSLLTSPNARVAAATLPLAVRWDANALAGEVKSVGASLVAKLGDKTQPDDTRAEIATTLLAVRSAAPGAQPAIFALLGSGASAALQTRVVEAIGEQTDTVLATELAKVLPKLAGEAQSAALNQLLKRTTWATALLTALETDVIPPTVLGPANIHRLRVHPDLAVAKRANDLMDKLRGPEAKEKAALLAKFTPEVQKPGNAAKGKELFTLNCATCHLLGQLGNNVGPNLTGMGAHGPAELLGQILDPNKEVDIAYVAISIETKDGELTDGIVIRENQAIVALKNAAGEKEIKKTDIKSRRNTGRSLMPEGFEALGAEGLRDVLAFITGSETRFRFIDLSSAFTASTRDGLYMTREPSGGALPLAKTGAVNAYGVPFNVVDPAKQPRNVMVLKGGANNSYSRTAMPRTVEAKVDFAAKQLHFLGNVGGWAAPVGQIGEPSLKITAHYAGGKTETLTFKNGEEIADYIREVDVPGSKLVRGVAGDGKQVRYASRKLTGEGVIEKLTFESADASVAPTTLAVTADLSADAVAPVAKGDGKKGKKNAGAPPPPPQRSAKIEWGAGTKVLLIGGGSSHDFQRFFNLADTAMLKAAKFSVNYTESPLDFVDHAKTVDVLVLSVNTPAFTTPAARKALFDHVAAGRGVVLLHAGVWYNYADWPEYNRELAGGGSRGHDSLGEYEVKATGTAHPIMKGVPASFRITDELYYFVPDASGTPIEVLATATSTKRPGTYPQVFVVKHPKARIAGLTLGHDARAHDLPEFKTLLVNCIEWVKK